ncbi:hypothetical protein A2615_05495 [Candidatus Curtissbacteria bacterium RIFOXYD1_FULL_41_36]|uniref:Uncharacterized protein n=1 Tax=Candidatus Curtissbacteria bacterium RIFOXYA1_FULL_41_14 TaxID=1797737 RepID=A0A1F5HE30_9BACT|nr:MAG: hypothetical protein UU00_C0029G0003 [Microgenomates group bacterium GW2011_GWC1_40_35]KKR75706.1 MAG: hypothetical protein UU19_C0050G0008 [Candidatus Curtissbacteria bacterium GW2011_GWD1_40_8]KKS00282.1 MAG: hypothetical protein UU53_C0039G0002 [Candidatus Curtissbacteria bacterium GW2011_GWC2_41_21]OGD91909.1 MAG: hypothetical protein A3E14_01460 [Candidatus Curtissbacteria bacterium RIFCSPHIGHO2_12_FULL_41_13]OGE02312.1 MAG: hypothetical protein A2196_04670 [Candidatus Curtissbacte
MEKKEDVPGVVDVFFQHDGVGKIAQLRNGAIKWFIVVVPDEPRFGIIDVGCDALEFGYPLESTHLCSERDYRQLVREIDEAGDPNIRMTVLWERPSEAANPSQA